MDERIQSRGVSLVSKCCCCVTSERETLNHLFIQSDLAKEVWGHLMSCTHVVFTGSTVQNLIYDYYHWVHFLWVSGDLEGAMPDPL